MPILGKFKSIFLGGENNKKTKDYSYIKQNVDPSQVWDIVGELGDGAFGKVYKVFILLHEE
jgi:STE20-like kinase